MRYINLHLHLRYQKTENLCCLCLNSVSGSEKNRFWCVSGCEKAGCVSRSQELFKVASLAFTHTRSSVCHWSMALSMMP